MTGALIVFIGSGVVMVLMLIGKSIMLRSGGASALGAINGNNAEASEFRGSSLRQRADAMIGKQATGVKHFLISINAQNVKKVAGRFLRAALVVIFHTWYEISDLAKRFLVWARRDKIPRNRGAVSLYLRTVSEESRNKSAH
jgi:hypothetical protein